MKFCFIINPKSGKERFNFVAFVVLGFIFIWIGYFTKQKFARNTKFRICHILAMGIVLCESLVGMICPLTEWENNLRLRGGQDQVYETSFIKVWIHKIMFFDFKEMPPKKHDNLPL